MHAQRSVAKSKCHRATSDAKNRSLTNPLRDPPCHFRRPKLVGNKRSTIRFQHGYNKFGITKELHHSRSSWGAQNRTFCAQPPRRIGLRRRPFSESPHFRDCALLLRLKSKPPSAIFSAAMTFSFFLFRLTFVFF